MEFVLEQLRAGNGGSFSCLKTPPSRSAAGGEDYLPNVLRTVSEEPGVGRLTLASFQRVAAHRTEADFEGFRVVE